VVRHRRTNATPPEIVEKLNKEINAGLADSNIKARLADLASDVLAVSPADARDSCEAAGRRTAIAKLRYVLAGSAKGPGVLVHNGHRVGARHKPLGLQASAPQALCPERGRNMEAHGPVLDPQTTLGTRLPPRVCVRRAAVCSSRRDAKTCSPRCRLALHRSKHR
jgi:hypothetical protein